MLTAVLTLALLDALLVVRPLVSLFDWRIMAADGAMAPTIPAGSLVLARPQSAKSLTVGAVISFGMAGDTGRRVISRVVLLEERDNQIAVVSRGDASDLAQNGGATRDVGRLDMFSLLVPRDSPVDRVVGWLPYFASLATWPAPAIVRVGLATIIAIAAVLLSIQALRRKRWRLRPLA